MRSSYGTRVICVKHADQPAIVSSFQISTSRQCASFFFWLTAATVGHISLTKKLHKDGPDIYLH
jgi:hypothetical protein